jgi:hypothetical protein
MAKGEANVRRRARESERRNTLATASLVAAVITSRRKNKADVAAEDIEYEQHIRKFLSNRLTLGGRLESDVFLGQTFCFFPKDPARFLRLVADVIEGKHPYRSIFDPGDGWHDHAIHAAYNKAATRLRFCEIRHPSFAEFLEIFLDEFEKKKNLKGLKPPSERSLRRALQRLGYFRRPDNRGRPRKNRDRKPRRTW